MNENNIAQYSCNTTHTANRLYNKYNMAPFQMQAQRVSSTVRTTSQITVLLCCIRFSPSLVKTQVFAPNVKRKAARETFKKRRFKPLEMKTTMKFCQKRLTKIYIE